MRSLAEMQLHNLLTHYRSNDICTYSHHTHGTRCVEWTHCVFIIISVFCCRILRVTSSSCVRFKSDVYLCVHRGYVYLKLARCKHGKMRFSVLRFECNLIGYFDRRIKCICIFLWVQYVLIPCITFFFILISLIHTFSNTEIDFFNYYLLKIHSQQHHNNVFQNILKTQYFQKLSRLY